MKKRDNRFKISLIIFVLFTVFFTTNSYGATVDNASLSPASTTLQIATVQTMTFSATNNKTFAIKTFHAEFSYTKGLSIASVATTPLAAKATVNSSKNIIILEWSSVVSGATVNATFNVSGSVPGTFLIAPTTISYIDNNNKTQRGTCNSAQIAVQNKTTGTVSGTVTDTSTGGLLQNVVVTIIDASQNRFSTTTNEAGYYNVLDVAQGNFTALFETVGFASYTVYGTLTGGQTLVLNAILTPDNLPYEIIRPTNAYNPGGWLNPASGFDVNIDTYASKTSISTSPSISFGSASSTESINAWQSKLQYWYRAWLYVTFEANWNSNDLVELQVTDRNGAVKHTMLAKTTQTAKMEFAQELIMSDWGDGFNNIADLRLRVNGYRTAGADNGEARVYDVRIDGVLSPPSNKYSRGSYSLLPGNDIDLQTHYTDYEVLKVSAVDGDRIIQNASLLIDKYPVHLFNEKVSSRNIKIRWSGQIGNPNYEAFAVSFSLGSSRYLNQISIDMHSVGSLSGSVRVRLKSEPGGSVLAESYTYPESNIPFSGWFIPFVFKNPAYLSAGKTYYAEIWRDRFDMENYLSFDYWGCPDRSGFVRGDGDWYATGETVKFKVDDYNLNMCEDSIFHQNIYGMDWKPIYLDIYNRITASWDRLDARIYDGSTSDMELSGIVSSDNYFDTDGWIAVRVTTDPAGNSSYPWYFLATDSIQFSALGEIDVTPELLDFGTVTAPSSTSQNILISNTGTGELPIGMIPNLSTPFAIASDGCSGVTLLASASCSLMIAFSPAVEGEFTGAVSIPYNDNTRNVSVILQGNAIPQLVTLSGVVTDSTTGTPLTSVQVKVIDAAGSQTVMSDTSGIYLVEGIHGTSFTAVFKKTGYVDQTINSTLPAGPTMTLNVQLQHAPSLNVVITAPQDENTVTASPVTVTGMVTNEASVTVNGVSVNVVGGLFSTSVPLSEGQNPITANASDQYGQTKSQDITVTLVLPKPPQISNISANNITTDLAVISWTTDQPSDSWVDYGETTAYGINASDAVLVTAHTITLNNLSPDKTYHFKVTSKNSDNLSSSSGDNTFTTLKFKATTLGDYGNITVMEVKGNYDVKNPDGSINYLPRQEIAKEFYRLHTDTYDFFVIFSNFDFALPQAEAKAYYLEVKNDILGIGRQILDDSSQYGSNSKLQGIIDMSNLSKLASNPSDPKFDETLDTLAHEQMHRCGSSVKFKDSSNNLSSALIGKDGVHWSYLLDTDGSLMHGNDWKDNGNGTFTSVSASKYYSPLDLYLMGFYDKTQVPQMLLVDNPSIDPTKLPEIGATITGTAKYVTIDNIIAAEGERVPNASSSQKSFKTAFILLTNPGTYTGNELSGIENIRNAWAGRFAVLTNGKGAIAEVTPSITIAISSPSNGDTISKPFVTVKGAFINNTGNETGIIVNGMPATVYDSQFIVNHVPLTEGQNTITVTATDTTGNTTTTSINVTAVTAGNSIRLTSNIESGILPFQVSLRIEGSFSITESDLDIIGPTQPEVLSLSPEEYQLSFNAEGTYYITASSAGPEDILYEDTITIVVLNKNKLDILFKNKWNRLKAALGLGDIEGALNDYLSLSKDKQRQLFTELGSDEINNIIAHNVDIILDVMGEDEAECGLIQQEDAGRYSYPINFMKDENGIWKIRAQ